MANAFISGRRYPSGGGIAMPSGSQSFTNSGTFTAPYTGVYTVALTAGHAASGAGGRGGRAVGGPYGFGAAGGGAGAGGSAYKAPAPGIIQVMLSQGQVVLITINSNMCSFGSFASFATGSSPGSGRDGGDATGRGTTSNPAENGVGGAGGLGGGKPTFTSGDVLLAITPTLPDATLSGGNGGDGKTTNYDKGGAAGIASNSIYGVTGQNGGFGESTRDNNYYEIGTDPIGPKIPAAAGRIDITWGNQ